MVKRANSKPDQSRRNMLKGFTVAAASTLLPLSTRGSSRLGTLHSDVASRAKAIANGNAVTLRILIPHGCLDNVAPVISQFKMSTGISIDVIETPVDAINTQLTLDTMSGEGNYDLALPATFGIPDLVSANAIIPLTSFAAQYEPAGFRDDVSYRVGDSFDGDLYGFQTDGDTYLMFYNRDYLENVNEQRRYEDTYGAVLQVPVTWQELDQQMAFFNRKSENMSGGLLFRTPGYLAWEWWVRFHAKGYWPLSETLVPQIDSDAGVEALEQMIRATEHLAPEVSELGLFENWERYSRGDVYCNIGWGGSQKYLNSKKSVMRNRMAYGPTPGGMVNNELLITPYFNWGWNYVVTSNSKQAELAYLFALFASTPIMSTVSVQEQGGYFDPFRPEHYNDPGIQSIYSKEFLDVHEASMKSSIPDLYLANQVQYFQSLNNWLDKAISGQVMPDIALKRVAQEWELINNRSDKQLQAQRWNNLRDKYPSQIRSRLRDVG